MAKGKSAKAKDARRRAKRATKGEWERSHAPFKRRSTTGPGPREVVTHKQDDWSCACKMTADKKKSVCTCEGISPRVEKADGTMPIKRVVIDLKRKRVYAAEYRAWRKKIKKEQARLKKGAKRRKG